MSMSDNNLKKTCLHSYHIKSGAKMTEFCGWQMPLQYEGILAEQRQVRSAGGLFDVSHMGRFRVQGLKALEFLEWLTCNYVGALKEGKAAYNLILNPQGGVKDDVIIYCVQKQTDYRICVNASNREKIWNWLEENKKENKNESLVLIDESEDWAQIAIQGPKSLELLSEVLQNQSQEFTEMKPFNWAELSYKGETLIWATTGYTGEKGGEMMVPLALAGQFWQELLDKGAALGVGPIGLGARDGLRLEMGYALYSQELDEDKTPFESSLSWVVKLDKKSCIASEALQQAAKKWALVGLVLESGGVLRHGQEVLNEQGDVIGQITSGGVSPSLNQASIAMAFIGSEYEAAENLKVRLRSREAVVKRAKPPFIR